MSINEKMQGHLRHLEERQKRVDEINKKYENKSATKAMEFVEKIKQAKFKKQRFVK